MTPLQEELNAMGKRINEEHGTRINPDGIKIMSNDSSQLWLILIYFERGWVWSTSVPWRTAERSTVEKIVENIEESFVRFYCGDKALDKKVVGVG